MSDLAEKLVNYKPKRDLADPAKTQRLDVVLPQATYQSYIKVPFFDHVTKLQGSDPSKESGQEFADKRKAFFKTLPISTVPTDNIVVTQKRVNTDRVAQIYEHPETAGKEPVHAVRYNNKTYILNGHHRLAAEVLAGNSHIKARVLDLDKKTAAGDDRFDTPSHDYDPAWDYEIDEHPHPEVVKAVESTTKRLVEAARHIGMGRPTVHYIKGGKGVATYAYGTAPHPVLMIDAKQHKDYADESGENLSASVHDSLFHEYGHAIQDWMGHDLDEDQAEHYAHRAYLDHLGASEDLVKGLSKTGAVVNPLQRPRPKLDHKPLDQDGLAINLLGVMDHSVGKCGMHCVNNHHDVPSSLHPNLKKFLGDTEGASKDIKTTFINHEHDAKDSSPSATLYWDDDKTSKSDLLVHTYHNTSPDGLNAAVLHELGHHIQRVRGDVSDDDNYLNEEKGAWDIAKGLAKHFKVQWTPEMDKLHDKSIKHYESMPYYSHFKGKHPYTPLNPSDYDFKITVNHDKGPHTINAYEKGGKHVGIIQWVENGHYRYNDFNAREPGRPYVDSIGVDDDHRNHGLATLLFRKAREIQPELEHSAVRTPDGDIWANWEEEHRTAAGGKGKSYGPRFVTVDVDHDGDETYHGPWKSMDEAQKAADVSWDTNHRNLHRVEIRQVPRGWNAPNAQTPDPRKFQDAFKQAETTFPLRKRGPSPVTTVHPLVLHQLHDETDPQNNPMTGHSCEWDGCEPTIVGDIPGIHPNLRAALKKQPISLISSVHKGLPVLHSQATFGHGTPDSDLPPKHRNYAHLLSVHLSEGASQDRATAIVLHELGHHIQHARQRGPLHDLLPKDQFERLDAEYNPLSPHNKYRFKVEADAWDIAKGLAKHLKIPWTADMDKQQTHGISTYSHKRTLVPVDKGTCSNPGCSNPARFKYRSKGGAFRYLCTTCTRNRKDVIHRVADTHPKHRKEAALLALQQGRRDRDIEEALDLPKQADVSLTCPTCGSAVTAQSVGPSDCPHCGASLFGSIPRAGLDEVLPASTGAGFGLGPVNWM